MGIFNENENEKKYKELIKIIRSADIDYMISDFLVNYVNEIKDSKRINDFFDFEFLREIIITILDYKWQNYFSFLDYFDELIDKMNFVFPLKDKTDDYELLKNMILSSYAYKDGIIVHKVFNKKFYSLFESKYNYIQIMNIICDDEKLIKNFDKIVDFSIRLSNEIEDEEFLKREIITYLHLFGSILSDEEDYLQKRIDEARMKYGIYPGIDEKTLSVISREVDKAKSILRKLEILDKKVETYRIKIDEKTKRGIEEVNNTIINGKKDIDSFSNSSILKMQKDLENAKKELLNELNIYLKSLEETLKNSSDQVFNQLLIDAREKIEQIRVIANSLSGNTTRELLRIQNETQRSLEQLKNYVEKNPELQSSLEIAKNNDELIQALVEYTESKKEAQEKEEKVTEIILPDTEFLVPKFEMTPGIIYSFDRTIPFDKRLKKIEKRIKRLEESGYIIPSALIEALPWYMMGKKIIYFYGPTQSGKTTIADLLVKVVETELLDGGKITEEHSITSYNDVRGLFDENALFYALYYGKTIFYDELDNGDTDNLVVLGTFSSKLVNKIDHPDREVYAQFAKRRFVPINANARIIAAGNTTGRGRNREYTARNRLDESSHERLVPIYVGYSEEVESKIFSKYVEWYDFFKSFRLSCNEWALNSSMDEAEGNVTTGDASTIEECIKENSVNISSLLIGLFIQTKEEDYLAFLIKKMDSIYEKSEISDEEIINYNNTPLEQLTAKDIANVFVYECQKRLNKGKKLKKK